MNVLRRDWYMGLLAVQLAACGVKRDTPHQAEPVEDTQPVVDVMPFALLEPPAINEKTRGEHTQEKEPAQEEQAVAQLWESAARHGTSSPQFIAPQTPAQNGVETQTAKSTPPSFASDTAPESPALLTEIPLWESPPHLLDFSKGDKIRIDAPNAELDSLDALKASVQIDWTQDRDVAGDPTQADTVIVAADTNMVLLVLVDYNAPLAVSDFEIT